MLVVRGKCLASSGQISDLVSLSSWIDRATITESGGVGDSQARESRARSESVQIGGKTLTDFIVGTVIFGALERDWPLVPALRKTQAR